MAEQEESREALQARLLREVKGGGAPATAAEEPAEPAADPAEPAAAPGGDGEWISVPDPEGSGDSYYWNRTTGETTWDEPPGFSSVASASISAAEADVSAADAAPAAAASSEPSEPSTATNAPTDDDDDDSRAGSAAAAPSGDAAADAPEEVKRTLWYYQDAAGQQQGPFPLSDMQQWHAQGFFPLTTLVRRLSDSDTAWTAIGEHTDIVAAAAAAAGAAAAAAAGDGDGAQYASTMYFNRHTGKFDDNVSVSMERQQDMYNHRAKRQLNGFFGVALPSPALLRSSALPPCPVSIGCRGWVGSRVHADLA